MMIGYCKIGKTLKFASKYSPTGGDNEGPAMLRMLANHNPDKTFAIIGRSDFRKLSDNQKIELFPFGNVIDLIGGEPKEVRNIVAKNLAKTGRTISKIIIMSGPIGTITIPNKIRQVKNHDLFASVIVMTLGYSTPIIEYINDNQDIPIIEIINDPRYTLRKARDIIPNPTKSLSQYDYTYIKSSIKSYEEQFPRIDYEIKPTYSEMEKIFLFDRVSPNTNRARNINFMIVLNEGKPSRYKMLNEWVLSNIDEVSIYGKWDEPRTVDDSRFVGSMELDQLQGVLNDVKSTFIIPIKKGWVTSKYIEMIHAGVIPFFHPTYDEQGHLGMIDFCRPKSPADLMNRIKQIETDDSKYSDIIDELQEKYCRPEYYDGTKLNDIVMSALDEDYVSPDIGAFNSKSNNTLAGFF